MSNKKSVIGEAISRIDGFLKVTGTANYAMDFPVNNVAYGYLFKSEIAAGKIISIDTGAAEKADGVIAVITHENTTQSKTFAKSARRRDLAGRFDRILGRKYRCDRCRNF